MKVDLMTSRTIFERYEFGSTKIVRGPFQLSDLVHREGMGGRVFQGEKSPQRAATLDAVNTIAVELGVTAYQVAISWAGTQGSVPMINARTLAQLEGNLGALAGALSAKQLDSASIPDPTASAKRPAT